MGGVVVPSVVRVGAVVRGMGVEAPCILETWKEKSSSGRVFTRCRVVEDPPNLPDGPYDVTIDGQTFSTRRWSGAWDLIYLPKWVRTGQAA
jgi:hypothetical protein